MFALFVIKGKIDKKYFKPIIEFNVEHWNNGEVQCDLSDITIE